VQVPQQRLDRAAGVYVITPQAGSYGAARYPDSGRHVAQAAHAALAKYTNKVTVGREPETIDSARRKAQAAGAAYVFEPTILNWEDRATEWSGLPDRITIKMVIWNAKTGSEVASTLARASSKWATFGGDHPQDLLPELMANFVDRLY
jgi:succinate dehydrogenase/fumarate reductase flavoprotein subunit